MTSRSSAPSLGRCRPVATRIRMFSFDIPAAASSSISGGSRTPWGTGRVMSQIRMHAVLAARGPGPAATAPAAGFRKDARSSAAGSGATGIGFLRIVVTLKLVGKIHGKLAAAVQQFDFHLPPRTALTIIGSTGFLDTHFLTPRRSGASGGGSAGKRLTCSKAHDMRTSDDKRLSERSRVADSVPREREEGE